MFIVGPLVRVGPKCHKSYNYQQFRLDQPSRSEVGPCWSMSRSMSQLFIEIISFWIYHLFTLFTFYQKRVNIRNYYIVLFIANYLPIYLIYRYWRIKKDSRKITQKMTNFELFLIYLFQPKGTGKLVNK